MSRMKITLIVIAAAFLVCLVVIGLRPDKPDAASASETTGGPSFEVRVVKPLSARPLFELLGLLRAGDLGFDHTSRGAENGRVGRDRLELIAEGWDLSIETDGEGKIASGTRLVFPLDLGGQERRLRCRPAVPAIGYLRSAMQAGPDELGGSFSVQLATCEIAETGKVIEWPPAPLTVRGHFERLPIAPAKKIAGP